MFVAELHSALCQHGRYDMLQGAPRMLPNHVAHHVVHHVAHHVPVAGFFDLWAVALLHALSSAGCINVPCPPPLSLLRAPTPHMSSLSRP